MEPDWNPDTAGRPLAEILREAGIESPSRSGRRRRSSDDTDTAIRQRGAGGPTAPPTGQPAYVRRLGDAHPSGPVPTPGRVRHSGPVFEPSTAAIPGLRPDRRPNVPGGSGPVERPEATSVARHSGPVRTFDEHPSTGPIPVVREADADAEADLDADLDGDLDASPRESALAWLRFAGELVIALAVGVGVYFLATVLWEMVPHVAVVLAPLAVTGLVAGVGFWRQRHGRAPMSPKLLAVLVFAGTLLTIAPAAGLLAAG